MTVWILQQNLTAEQEAHIHERTHLTLPFEGLPDLRMVQSPIEARHLLKALHPEDPPEAITRRLDKFWNLYATLHEGDIIAVPLPISQKVAIAETTGGYEYQVGESASDVHHVPVKWYPKTPALASFRKHRNAFNITSPMLEVTEREVRTAIRDNLPHSYNRFAGIKWLLIIFFGMRLIRFLHEMLTGQIPGSAP